MNEDELLRQLIFHRGEYLRLSSIADKRGLVYQKTEEDKIRTLASELDEANQRLAKLVVTDPLTGIGNRRLYLSRLDDLLHEAARGRALSVLLIDVDEFKQYNDSHGHPAGDEALKEVALALKGAVRKSDCLARYGGEEFVVASAIDISGACILGEKLRLAVQSIDALHRLVTVSIGITCFHKDDTSQSITSRADRALYCAKGSGRNKVVISDIDKCR